MTTVDRHRKRAFPQGLPVGIKHDGRHPDDGSIPGQKKPRRMHASDAFRYKSGKTLHHGLLQTTSGITVFKSSMMGSSLRVRQLEKETLI